MCTKPLMDVMLSFMKGCKAVGIAVALLGGLAWTGCSTGVEESPDPGILRVVLQTDPADTTIEIAGQQLTVSPSDSFGVTIFQGRAFRDTTFAILFKSIDSYREQDFVYNVLKQSGGGFEEFVIFESLIPPGMYDRLQFGVTAEFLQIGNFQIPVQLPPDARPLMDFDVAYEIESEQTTQITVRLKPLASVERFRDLFLFRRQFEVVGVSYL